MVEIKRVTWGVTDFPESVKNKFMGQCLKENKDWKDVLEYLLRKYVVESESLEKQS